MNIEMRLLGIMMATLVAGLAIGPVVIPVLRRLKVGQVIREDGPASHFKKSGTPTMGGVLFLLPLLLTTLFFVSATDRLLAGAWLWLVAGFGFVGFLDDYIKVVNKQSLGLRARQKLLGQIIVATVFYFMLMSLDVPTYVAVPGWGRLELGWLYLPFVVFMSVAEGNAVNLTDGVDGLAASTTAIACLAYVFIGLATGVQVVSLLCAALIGALLAFLRFNWHPASVIMGDVGSLSLGAALAGAAVLTKTELLLIPIGLVFVIETLSVMLQVTYFRITGGRRLFHMAPIHHHYELKGWPETKIVGVWCLMGVLGGLLGLWALASIVAV